MTKNSKSLYVGIVRSIKESIFRGDFAPGELLPSEMELSQQLGVSRPVIREALRILQIQGFIHARRGNRGGTYITDLNGISIEDNLEDLIRLGKISIADLTQARLLIEPEAFRQAARRASQKQLDEMARVIRESRATRDPKLRIKLNTDFHRLVIKASGNPFYSRFMKFTLDFVERFIMTFKPANFRIHEDRDHADIYEALCQHDVDRVSTLVEKHIKHVTDNMAKLEKEWLQTITDRNT